MQHEGDELGLGYPARGERDREPEAVWRAEEEEEVPVPRPPAPVAVAVSGLGRLWRSCPFAPWMRQLVTAECVPVWVRALLFPFFFEKGSYSTGSVATGGSKSNATTG